MFGDSGPVTHDHVFMMKITNSEVPVFVLLISLEDELLRVHHEATHTLKRLEARNGAISDTGEIDGWYPLDE